MMERSNHNFVLPDNAVGIVDINRLIREMKGVDAFLHQAAIRQPGSPMTLPKLGKLFDELVATNNLNLLHENDRNALRVFLTDLPTKAPRIHVSFSVDPSPLFLQRLMTYMRSKIHPLVLVQIGMQPNIGAGCVLRTPNKVFDLSLREDFRKKRDILMQYISSLESPPEAIQSGVEA